MAYRQTYSKALLQRRSSFSQMLQQFLDCASVIGVTLFLLKLNATVIDDQTPYVIMLLVLLGILAILYDKFAIYRSNYHFIDKALNLLKAWTFSFVWACKIIFL